MAEVYVLAEPPSISGLSCASSVLLSYCRMMRALAYVASASEGTQQAIRMLVEALTSSNEAVVAEAAGALTALTENAPMNAELLRREGALRPLVAVVNAQGAARAIAMKALLASFVGDTARCQELASAIDELGAMASLVGMAVEGVRSEACYQAVLLLQALSELSPQQCDQICNVHGIAPIMALVCSGSKCQVAASRTLTALLESSKESSSDRDLFCESLRTRQFCESVRALREQARSRR